jgi:hypothetical protein
LAGPVTAYRWSFGLRCAADVRRPKTCDWTDDFYQIDDGVAALWIVWDSLANGGYMDASMKRLGPKLGLGGAKEANDA